MIEPTLTVLLMGLFALPLAAVIILAVIIPMDIKASKTSKQFKSLVNESVEKLGLAYTNRILDKCKGLPMESMITVLEHHLKT